MASQSIYQRIGNPSFIPPLASITSTDPGHMYQRDMGPPSSDYPPQPVEIDLNLSRTLPNPSVSVSGSVQWESAFPSQGFGDIPYGGSSMPRMSTTQSDGQNRGPSENPLVNWYSANDGPWAPFPKVGTESVVDDRLLLKQTGNRNMSYSGQYRQQNPSDTNFHFGVPPSDSGYGTRRSVGNTSVFSADVHDRDPDSHSIPGPVPDFQSSFQGYNEVLQQRDSRTSGTWSSPTSHPSESPGLTCPTCHKPVKTQSELKKHDLRHRKPYVCEVPGCLRTEGFSTTNDLERHTKSKHPSVIPENVSTKKFRCRVPGCKSKDKAWPRLDNFRSHLKRVHASYLRTDEAFEEMIRRAEFWERTGITLELEVTLQPNPHLEATRSARPVQDSLPNHGKDQIWNQYPEIMDRSQDFIPANGPQSGSYGSKVPSPEEKSPQSEGSLPTTVQPVEVLRVPTQIPESRMMLNNLLSTNNIDPSLKKTEQAMPHLSSRISPQGKAPRQTVSATDATLTEVIQKALAGANVSDASTERVRNQESERSSLPNGKISSRGSWTAGPIAATSNSRASDPIKVADSPSKDVSKDLEAQKKAEEVLNIIRNLGYTVSKDPTHASPKVQNLGSAASNKSEHQVTCGTCQKFRGRPCELRKHMKRHDRPYGCTFITCNKYFGSKNDWKRHENSQHFHLETWRCDEERPEGGACAKACYRRQTFQEHLKKEHSITEPEPVKRKIDACRIGRNCQARFWCGFCKKLVDLKKKGLEAWTERFDHIDDHFMGRAPFPKQSIQDWVPVDGDKPKGDVVIPFPLGSGSESKSQDETEASPSGSGSPTASEGQMAASPIVLEEDAPKLKRPASDEAETQTPRPAKKARSYKDYETRVYCCQCQEPHNLRFYQSCTTCTDPHLFCDACPKEAVRITDKTPALPPTGQL